MLAAARLHDLPVKLNIDGIWDFTLLTDGNLCTQTCLHAAQLLPNITMPPCILWTKQTAQLQLQIATLQGPHIQQLNTVPALALILRQQVTVCSVVCCRTFAMREDLLVYAHLALQAFAALLFGRLPVCGVQVSCRTAAVAERECVALEVLPAYYVTFCCAAELTKLQHSKSASSRTGMVLEDTPASAKVWCASVLQPAAFAEFWERECIALEDSPEEVSRRLTAHDPSLNQVSVSMSR